MSSGSMLFSFPKASTSLATSCPINSGRVISLPRTVIGIWINGISPFAAARRPTSVVSPSTEFSGSLCCSTKSFTASSTFCPLKSGSDNSFPSKPTAKLLMGIRPASFIRTSRPSCSCWARPGSTAFSERNFATACWDVSPLNTCSTSCLAPIFTGSCAVGSSPACTRSTVNCSSTSGMSSSGMPCCAANRCTLSSRLSPCRKEIGSARPLKFTVNSATGARPSLRRLLLTSAYTASSPSGLIFCACPNFTTCSVTFCPLYKGSTALRPDILNETSIRGASPLSCKRF
mmetsp:Transcript_28263/g.53823  ORF Transcript_28263/g.53823 Transcript_28263/m.53823 type:complete len:288 (-) Transcript_28263:1239-2102(-)